jgi:NMD protein affecting ribosome stability and mRNA decay
VSDILRRPIRKGDIVTIDGHRYLCTAINNEAWELRRLGTVEARELETAQKTLARAYPERFV